MERKADEARELETRKASVLTSDGFYDNKDGFIAFVNNASPSKFHDGRVKLDLMAGPLTAGMRRRAGSPSIWQ